MKTLWYSVLLLGDQIISPRCFRIIIDKYNCQLSQKISTSIQANEKKRKTGEPSSLYHPLIFLSKQQKKRLNFCFYLLILLIHYWVPCLQKCSVNFVHSLSLFSSVYNYFQYCDLLEFDILLNEIVPYPIPPCITLCTYWKFWNFM